MLTIQSILKICQPISSSDIVQNLLLIWKPYGIKEEDDLKQFLESIGDSIVCVSDDEIVKIHVHTNHPGQAFEKGLTFGYLSNMKVDNMRLEHHEKVIKQAEREEAARQEAARQAEKENSSQRNNMVSSQYPWVMD